ncbi:MAG: 2-amino-4-hydroxy-6-hydroxymethyldihydropteridine diphosphokinase, partial [Anaerolineae bacterium]
LVLSTPQLQIPHPRLHERAFVLIPLSEVAPNLIHPVLNSDVEQLRHSVASPEEIRLYGVMDWTASG